MGFDVHIVEGSEKFIKDVHLGYVLETAPDTGGTINIAEKVTNPESGQSLLEENLVVDNNTQEAWADLIYPVKKARVLKDIKLEGVNKSDPNSPVLADVEASIIIQEFSQTVPEPGAVTGLLAIGSLSIGAMLKRHFGKKA